MRIIALLELSHILIGHGADGLDLFPTGKTYRMPMHDTRVGTVQDFQFPGSTYPGNRVLVEK